MPLVVRTSTNRRHCLRGKKDLGPTAVQEGNTDLNLNISISSGIAPSRLWLYKTSTFALYWLLIPHARLTIFALGDLTAKRPIAVTTLLFSALVRPWMVLRAKLGSALARPPFPLSCLGGIMVVRIRSDLAFY